MSLNFGSADHLPSWFNDSETQKCLCGSRKCRGSMGKKTDQKKDKGIPASKKRKIEATSMTITKGKKTVKATKVTSSGRGTTFTSVKVSQSATSFPTKSPGGQTTNKGSRSVLSKHKRVSVYARIKSRSTITSTRSHAGGGRGKNLIVELSEVLISNNRE